MGQIMPVGTFYFHTTRRVSFQAFLKVISQEERSNFIRGMINTGLQKFPTLRPRDTRKVSNTQPFHFFHGSTKTKVTFQDIGAYMNAK